MELERVDAYPTELVATMKDLGLFGVMIPEGFGGLGLDLVTYAEIQMELSRGWMSLSGVLNTHAIAAWMIATHGTDEQRTRYLPSMAAGDDHAAFSMTEPHAGSDVQSIRTTAMLQPDGYHISGQKMWATNGLRSSIVMLLTKTDPAAEPAYRGMTAFIVEKRPSVESQPGLTIPGQLKKLGYKGVETTELIFDDFVTPTDSVLGGEAGVGKGFAHFMSGVELGRVNVAARAVGLATASLHEAMKYAQERHAFGNPISDLQSIQNLLADMATKVEASRLLTLSAAEKKATGERADLECGMAKLFATEAVASITLDAMRIHGGYGYSSEFVVERYYRDAPLLVLGEGTNEVQRGIIARRLLERFGARS
jgi:butyryl-CoA dehydrogenase